MLITSKNKNELSVIAFLLICFILAFFFRISGLSIGGFSNSDEYYIAKSVHNILEYGVPKYPLGGYYARGLIYQYLSALLLILGIKEEFALRIIPLLFNMLTIPALYLLGKKIGGRVIGISIVFLFCFSILEIEYARLARYYTPFQSLFVWYVYFFYKAVVEKDLKSFKWMLILSFTGIFMYEGGIFLVLLNFIPFLLNRSWIKFSKVFYSISIFFAAFIFLNIDFRNYDVTNYLPSDVKISSSHSIAPIDLPYLFIQSFPDIYWYLVFVIPLAISVVYGFYIMRNINEKRTGYIFIFLTFLALLNLYGLLVITFLLLYLVNWIKSQDLNNKYFFYLLFILLFNFIFYLVFALTTNSWLRFFPEESTISINKIFWVLINYPNFYQKIFIPWFTALPVLTTTALLFFVLYFLINFVKSKIVEREELGGANVLLTILIILTCLVALLKTPYNHVRYTFFIYPLVVLFLVFSMKSISEYLTRSTKISYGIYFLFLLAFIFTSSDYNINHLLKIDTKDIRFRTVYEPTLENIYYFQEDYLTPADIINRNLNDRDIVATTQAPIEYYLKRLDYKYLNYADGEFTIRSRMNGTKEVWTNANLIYKEEDFLNLLENSKSTIWLSNFSNKRPGVNSLEEKINDEFNRYLYYVNYDSTINVYRIPPS